jgi:putative heme-binding domain-containing protein
MPGNPGAALKAAELTSIPQLADDIYWYAATLQNPRWTEIFATLDGSDSETLRRRAAGLWLAVEPRKDLVAPDGWKTVAMKLNENPDLRVRRDAQRLAAAFGDDSMFPQLRQTLADGKADLPSRRHAFSVLSRGPDRASLPIFLRLLDDKDFRSGVLNLLARFDDASVSAALLKRFGGFSMAERGIALNTLTTRAGFAVTLLDAVASGQIKRDQLTAYHVRQLLGLKNPEVDKRVTAGWGRIVQTPAEKQARIEKLENTFSEAPLWAYDSGAGQKHFQKLCSTCHRIGNEGMRLGPELTGAGKHGVRYFLENIIDPDAVIGVDFQMTTIETKGGDVLSGLVVGESANSVTLRTVTAEMAVPKGDIAARELSPKSLMPEGLIESLNDREQIELLKFLTTH